MGAVLHLIYARACVCVCVSWEKEKKKRKKRITLCTAPFAYNIQGGMIACPTIRTVAFAAALGEAYSKQCTVIGSSPVDLLSSCPMVILVFSSIDKY